jgi:hypothetical protein
MLTSGKIAINLVLLGIAVLLGSLISIITDYVLSDPDRFNWSIFSNSKYIGVFAGSFLSGIAYRKGGWLAGIIVSLIQIIYIYFLLTYPPSFIQEENATIEWHLHFHTGILLIIIGLVAGFFGSQFAKALTRQQKTD